MNFRRVLVAGFSVSALVLVGCAPQTTKTGMQPGTLVSPGSQARYDVVGGRNAELVARLRAAPAPTQPRVSDGNTRSGDENFLREQGLVEIGIGHFPAADVSVARDEAVRRGVQVGADAVRIYRPNADSLTSSPAELVATYFVRLQLPFGADFRDLTPEERVALGSDGVEIGNVIGRTPASAANLRSGDFVIGFNRSQIKDKAAFQTLLQSHMGRNVTLTLRRGNVTIKRLVRLGTLPNAAVRPTP
ncbi:MAG TPA: PDZ domain-containing protein [Rudaea sp.]|nr:PDZ domain-containing protein [Rudaea sp.]